MEDLKAFSSRFRLWGNVAAVRPSGLSSYSSTYDFVWHPSAHSRMRQSSLEYKSNLANRSTAFLPGASAIRTNLAARRTSLSSFLPGIHLIPKLKQRCFSAGRIYIREELVWKRNPTMAHVQPLGHPTQTLARTSNELSYPS